MKKYYFAVKGKDDKLFELKVRRSLKRNMLQEYNPTKNFYCVKKIDELIFNDSSHYSALFKEYLLLEDGNEFLKKFYPSKDSKVKLKNILYFYEKYSKIFPNYTIMSGSKYLYKNIQKKQKMIDNLQEIKKQENYNRNHPIKSEEIFDMTAVNSIMNESTSFYFKKLSTIMCLDMNDSCEGIEKILKAITENEAVEKKNLILTNNLNSIIRLPTRFKERVGLNQNDSKSIESPQNSGFIKTGNFDILSYTRKKTEIKNYNYKYEKVNVLNNNSVLNNNKAKLVLHKKINSIANLTNRTTINSFSRKKNYNDGEIIYNGHKLNIKSPSNLKRKILSLENRKENNHMKTLSINEKANFFSVFRSKKSHTNHNSNLGSFSNSSALATLSPKKEMLSERGYRNIFFKNPLNGTFFREAKEFSPAGKNISGFNSTRTSSKYSNRPKGKIFLGKK